MSFVSLRFDGKIIEELSQKIPSTLFALNELIKNAYDAFSPDVTVKIQPSSQTIIISDNGNGMDADEIEKLFHISRSSKNYGRLMKQDGVERITQGSKGLGFLAAFKFGNDVSWVTCKNGVKSSFALNKRELVSNDDLSGFKVPMVTEPHDKKGTTISIQCDSAQMNELLEDLNDKRIAEKLVAIMADDSFSVNVEIEHQKGNYSTKKITPYVSQNEARQLFYVTYSSSENKIYFYHKGEILDSISGLEDKLLRTDYSIDLELIIFDFTKYKRGDSISPLHIRTHDDAIYPLVYINRNLFNNTVLFDPDIYRKKKSDMTLPQMIGRVCLTTQSKQVDFNSDRTNFVENELTRNIAKNLIGLNKLIQTRGAELKTELKKENKGKIPIGKAIPIDGSNDQAVKVASILVNNKKPVDLCTNSAQIDLAGYIFQVKNSLGEIVDTSEIEILVDGTEASTRILESVPEPCEKTILFKYNDPQTGFVVKEIKLKFEKPLSSITGVPFSESESLFPIESNSGYQIRQGMVSSLTYAIDKAWLSRSTDDYLPLIACSIRAIFDISVDKVFKERRSWLSKLNKTELDKDTKKAYTGLVFNVLHVVILLKKNQGLGLMKAVADTTGIEFTTLSNLLDLRGFKTSVEYSHIGAHRSTTWLTKPKIRECAQMCGLFAAICDVLIHFEANEARQLNVAKVEEADLKNYLETAR
jgi:hypothetical protein